MEEEIEVTQDIVYGSALVGMAGAPRQRALTLDMYAPARGAAGRARPALIMAFGGAFHRGDKRADEFEQSDGQRNTPVSGYCRLFARRGWVACSIDYRLVQEDPDPGSTRVIAHPETIPLSRVAHVRQLLGLPPADARTVWAGIEAAADDMAMAFNFMQAGAARFGVDPSRIVLGGFSAGARTALNAAYGERVPAAAVVSLSGYLGDDELARCVVAGRRLPPAFFVSGEHDLDYIAAQTGRMQQHFQTVGLDSEAWQVPAASHFYPATSTVVRADGERSTLIDAMADFLERHA